MVDETEEEEFKPSRKDLLLWLGVLGLAGILVIAFRGKWGMFQADLATFDACMLILIVFVVQEGITWFKHKTPKLIYDGNPGHTTFFVKDLRKVGRWGIAKKGGIIAAGIYYPGSEGTLIAPYDSFSSVGECIVSTAKCELTKLSYLPLTVRKYVSDNRFPQPVEFGLFTTNQLRTPAIAQMKEEMLEQNSLIAMYQKYLKDVIGVKEDLTDWIKRIGKKETAGDELKKMLFETKGE